MFISELIQNCIRRDTHNKKYKEKWLSIHKQNKYTMIKVPDIYDSSHERNNFGPVFLIKMVSKVQKCKLLKAFSTKFPDPFFVDMKGST